MRRITGDQWTGVHNTKWEIENPSVEDFKSFLERLDAKVFTILTIWNDTKRHMVIGGGAGRYVVYASLEEEEFWNLQSSKPGLGKVLLIAGGQEGDFPATHVVTKEQAQSAGRIFLEVNELDQNQDWVKQ